MPQARSVALGFTASDQPSAGPKFLGATGAYYGQLVTDPRFVNNAPAQSYLIVHSHLAGPGQGVDPSPAQAQAITDWITQENSERLLPAPPPSAMTPYTELMKFAKCMSLTDYNSTGMSNIWKTQTSGNTGACNACHQNGEHQVTLSVDANRNFAGLADVRHLLRLAVADVNPDGSLVDIVAAKRFYERGQEVGHPQFAATAVQPAVDQFFQLTYAKYKAGSCP